MTPRATYRLQLTADFPFSAAQEIVPYLSSLGISHVYASPITKARRGSTHGYDVVDPTQINPELGGEDDYRSLVTALRSHGMGIIIDIVPNHMGVAGGENRWWNDILRLGKASPYAHFFDIDWNGPLILPILGAPLDEVVAAGELVLDSSKDPHLLLYGNQRLPLRPDGPITGAVTAVAAAQHYSLVDWRAANDSLNWRRFFSINDLAGLRVEDPDVFEATHALYLRLYRDGLLDGLRIDHVDGLTDPIGYCRTLRAHMDAIRPGSYIVIEKILGVNEALPTDWGINGTSGYDFMRDVIALLHDPSGEKPLGELWTVFDADQADWENVVPRAKHDMLEWQFEGQLAACVASFTALARSSNVPAVSALTAPMLRRAIARLLQAFPVYRTYGSGQSSPPIDDRARQDNWTAAKSSLPPGEAWIARQILEWLAGNGPGLPHLAADAVRRFQQLSAPIAAKGVEDTAFYRRAALLSANEVGSAPEQFSISPEVFHHRATRRGEAHPSAMLATATHDHKRGEDNRARLAVLSGITGFWREKVETWSALSDRHRIDVHPADRYQLFQTLVGSWPGEAVPHDFGDRVLGWQQKALREARLRSSWEDPDKDYEKRAEDLVRALLGDIDFVADMADFQRQIGPAANANSLVQTALKFCVPGVPDIFQGCELADLSLVDPDNRRPVDFGERANRLSDIADREDHKLRLITLLLDMRRSHPRLFAEGSYASVAVTGDKADHLLAFSRHHQRQSLLCVVMIRLADIIVERGGLPPASWWGNTVVQVGDGIAASELFTDQPVYITLKTSLS